MTPAVLMLLKFAAGTAEVAAAVSGISQRTAYTHRRKRPYGGFAVFFSRWSRLWKPSGSSASL
jgi:hypothetical protein